MEKLYDHEKLKVYQLSLDFVEWRDGILGMIKKKDKCLRSFG